MTSAGPPPFALAVLLAALLVAGCRSPFYTAGDRKMVSAGRDQLRRADASLAAGDADGAGAHVRLADEPLGQLEDRHGRSRAAWPEEDPAAAVAVERAVGEYQAGTRLLSWVAGWRPSGLLGWLIDSPVTAGLAALAPPLFAGLLLLARRWKRKLEETEEAALAAVDGCKAASQSGAALVDAKGDGTEALRKAAAPLAEVYRRRRKG
jgi:Flp pilus assembly protein TadB